MSLHKELSLQEKSLAVRDKLHQIGVTHVGIDFDDTLIDTNKMFKKAIDEGCGRLIYADDLDDMYFVSRSTVINNIERVKKEFFSPVLNGLRAEYGIRPVIMQVAMDRTAKILGINENTMYYQMAMDRIQAIYETDTPEAYPGAIHLVDTLNESGVSTILMTHAEEDWSTRKRLSSGFFAKFENTVCFDIERPKADQWQEKLEMVGALTSDFLVIGDNIKSDILPVVHLGSRAVWVDNGIGAHKFTTDESMNVDQDRFESLVVTVNRTSEVVDAIITQM